MGKGCLGGTASFVNEGPIKMDIESLKKIDFSLKIKREKPGPFFSNKKRKAKPREKEEKNKSRIDMKV